MMDMQAKARVDQIFAKQMPPPPMSIKFEGWRCSIDDVKLMSDPAGPLLQWIHYAPMKTFLSHLDHFQMLENSFNLVDWQAVHQSLKDFPEMFRIWASKHMSHFCGISRMQKVCGFWDNSRCPQCQATRG
jgi:hypothetical protein